MGTDIASYVWFGGSIAISVLALSGLLVALRNARRLRDHQELLELLRQDVRGLCAGALGLDERLARSEHQARRLRERQEQIELRDSGDRLYHQAIRMVHNGADIDELVKSCGLSRNEAELIVMMHRVDRAS